MKSKIAFVSLGCDKNSVDSEIMLGILDRAGYNIVSDESEADIIIVNTCCFIQSAIEESIENILEMVKYKEEGICKAVIITGCMAERYREQIFSEIPEVDAIVGTASYQKIAEIVDRVLNSYSHAEIFENIDSQLDESDVKDRILSTTGYAYLKIAEGCDNHCTYCIIPKVRGKYRSRTIESLLEEAKMLADKGIKEIIVVAQDTTLYGIDLYGEKKLVELLKKLASIDGIEWIRLMYAYPENIDNELIEAIACEPKICNYIDMPIQHCDDRILKKMARKSSQAQIENTVRRLRESIPDICIRTTIITGFPSESEIEFKNLLEFIKYMKFDRLGVFTYSQEEGTPAYSYPNQIEESVKQKRKDTILELQKSISARKCENSVGKTFEVLVEGKLSDCNVYCGRTYQDAPDIDGLVFINTESQLMSGEFVSVHINEASDYDLVGVIVHESSK